MSITFINSATGNGTNVTSVTINKPTSTVDGHVMVAFISISTLNTITAPAGWTTVAGQPVDQNPERMHIFTKVASGEGANYQFTFSNSRTAGAILSYSGVNTASIVDVRSGAGGTSTTATGTSVTTTQANDVLLFAVSIGSDSTFTTPGGMTPRASELTASSQDMAVFDELIATASATGSRASTVSNAQWVAQMLTLKEAPAASGSPRRSIVNLSGDCGLI